MNPRCTCPSSAPQAVSTVRSRRGAPCRAVEAPEAPTQEEARSTPTAEGNGLSGLNTYSRIVTQPKKQGGSQAMLYAVGMKEDDMHKPQVTPPHGAADRLFSCAGVQSSS